MAKDKSVNWGQKASVIVFFHNCSYIFSLRFYGHSLVSNQIFCNKVVHLMIQLGEAYPNLEELHLSPNIVPLATLHHIARDLELTVLFNNATTNYTEDVVTINSDLTGHSRS